MWIERKSCSRSWDRRRARLLDFEDEYKHLEFGHFSATTSGRGFLEYGGLTPLSLALA